MSNIDPNNLPQHVTITMDGNRRWAKQRGLSAIAGHQMTVEKRTEEIIERAAELGIPYVTFWAWTTENWQRPRIEILAIMNLFRSALKKQAPKLIKQGARLRIIGDMSKFPKDIQQGMEEMQKASEHNQRINVAFALNYGGRDEILRAIRKLHQEILNTEYEILNLNEKSLSDFLDTAGMPDPDLMIRPGGRQRLSGLMPWQSVYAELYFTDVLQPDFGAEEFDKAIVAYQSRERTYGSGDFRKMLSQDDKAS